MKIMPFSSFLFLLTVFLFMLILIDFQGQGFEIFVGKEIEIDGDNGEDEADHLE